MRIAQILALGLISFSLVACANSPYPEGKSIADVPAHVDVIQLRPIQALDGMTSAEKSKLPEKKAEPSQNDLEAIDIVKKAVVSQLTNYGYKIVEDNEKADLALQYYVDYIPEYGLLINRTASVSAYALLPNSDEILFRQIKVDGNRNGLIGALFSSRDGMLSGVASSVTIKTVEELKKGTKENISVKPASKENEG